MKLHLGCGETHLDDYTNVDVVAHEGCDLVLDLDGTALAGVLAEDSVTESVGRHFLEHLDHPLDFMEALWRVTEPGGTAWFEVPYGSSDDAWEDPTHRRPYFINSWAYFSQPTYYRADYGYRGDWRLTALELYLDKDRWASASADDVMEAVNSQRNVVKFMRAEMEAVKPARKPDRDGMDAAHVRLVLV